jgi:RNA polymerase sigma factor (sigma-70 family)
MAIPESARAISTDELASVPTAEQLAAWELLYEQSKVPLSKYITGMLTRGGCFDVRDHALDVGQVTWMRAALSIDQCDRSPKGWLFRIAHNNSVDHLKQCNEEKNRGVSFSETPEDGDVLTLPSARLHSPEELYLFRIIYAEQLDHLSPEQLQVLELRNDGVSYQEIHLRTGISPANARQMFHRAKLIIKGILAEGVR